MKRKIFKVLVAAVFAMVSIGCSAFDTSVDTPKNVTATTNDAHSITIRWNSVKNATEYNVHRSANESGPYSQRATVKTGTHFNDTHLSAGTTYFYRITARNDNSDKESSPSSPVRATTFVNAPGGVNARVNSSSSITVSWWNTSGAERYRVYRSTSEFGTYNRIGETTFTSYEDSGLATGAAYFYRVSALNVDGVESPQSSIVTATTTR